MAATVTSATSTKLVVNVPDEATTGKVTVKVNHHVATSSQDFEVIILGVEDREYVSGGIFPNPATNIISVDLSAFEKSSPVEVKIRNTFGGLVSQSVQEGNATCLIDVSSFPSGLYFAIVKQRGARRVMKFWKE